MWKPCTNCDDEGGGFKDSDTWTPCSKCDGVGRWDITDKKIETIINRLKIEAHRGICQIEAGDVYRLPLPDHIFSRIVPCEWENRTIATMVVSDEWYRDYDGFILKEEFQP